jgi:hypothetical protein
LSFAEYDKKQYNNSYTKGIIRQLNAIRAGLKLDAQCSYNNTDIQHLYNCYDSVNNAIKAIEFLDKELSN